jgi:hypothetical protein
MYANTATGAGLFDGTGPALGVQDCVSGMPSNP